LYSGARSRFNSADELQSVRGEYWYLTYTTMINRKGTPKTPTSISKQENYKPFNILSLRLTGSFSLVTFN